MEIAYKIYNKGDREERHYHKIATEISLVAKGRIKLNGREFSSGDIIVIQPNEVVEFESLENSETVVVKYPGANNDKYLGDADENNFS